MFILRGFPKEIRKEQIYTWQYALDREPIPTNISNVSVVGDFYGAPDAEVQADPAITEIESLYAALVTDLIEMPVGRVKDTRVGSFVAHLSGRTKNIRLGFVESVSLLLDALEARMRDAEDFARMILPAAMKEENILAELRKNFPYSNSSIEKARVREIQKRTKKFVAQHPEEIVCAAALVLKVSRDTLASSAANGQNRALLKTDMNTEKAELFQQLHWHVEDRMENLILGDSACLFQLRGDEKLYPFPEDPKNIEAIYLPLTKNRVLIGTAHIAYQSSETATLNEASSRCSREYYVSSQGPEVHGLYRPLINTGAIFFSKGKIDEIAREMFGNLGRPKSN